MMREGGGGSKQTYKVADLRDLTRDLLIKEITQMLGRAPRGSEMEKLGLVAKGLTLEALNASKRRRI